MIQAPTEVPPIRGRKWEWIVDRCIPYRPRWRPISGVRFLRQPWRVLVRNHPAAYWVRYWDWFLELEAFGYVFRLWHFSERSPRPEDY